MSTTVVQVNQTTFREMHAKRIRELMVNWTSNAVELGERLKAVRESFPMTEAYIGKNKRHVKARIGWKAWLKAELSISEQHAAKLIRVYEKVGHRVIGLPVSIKVLELLASSTIPASARYEIIGRIGKGEKVGSKAAKNIVQKHYPKPMEANKIARETGTPTLASDGYIYFGASKAEAKVINDRRGVVFAVRRAIATLSAMQISPHQFLQYALPHQLLKMDDHGEIAKAAEWMTAFRSAWQHRK